MAVYPREKAGEFLGVLLLASCLLLGLALFSYDSLDPSASVVGGSGYANYVGRFGAWTSDILFQLLGLPALLLPLPFLFLGYRCLRGFPLDFLPLKATSFTLAVLSLSAGVSVLAPDRLPWANFATGGIAGIVLSQLLLASLNRAGALIVVATLLVLSLLVNTRLSLKACLRFFVDSDWHLRNRVSQRYRRWQVERNRRREVAELRKERRTVVAQPLPKTVKLEPDNREKSDEAPRTPKVAPVLSEVASEAPATELQSRHTLRPERKPVYQPPSLDYLQRALEEIPIDEQQLIDLAHRLAEKCAEFDVTGRVLQIHPGPVVTTFEFKPDPGVKYSRITTLADDLCLALRAESIRIDRIPGKNTVGIEVPNPNRRVIYLREILASAAFQHSRSRLTLGLGQLINGSTYVTDLARMPHLLIAGSTGSGKSVGLNCMVCSILYKCSPEEVRFIMVDPKRLELGVYDGIPHLLTPIITDPKQAANALNWAVREMENRYKLLAQLGVRNIEQYNKLVQSGQATTDDEENPTRLPFIIVIVDELADLMLTSGKDVEAALTRLAQMARAVGIHLILATQRPSVDVITGLIKANFPSRISYRVSSKVDSRTILDSNGGEQLLGMGDMLFLSPGTSRLVRIHGGYLSETEIANITEFLKAQGEPAYLEEVLENVSDDPESALLEISEMNDELYDEAVRFVVETRKASTSLLQRRFRIGYGRAARLLDIMEHEGIVGPSEGSKARQILVEAGYFEEVEGH